MHISYKTWLRPSTFDECQRRIKGGYIITRILAPSVAYALMGYRKTALGWTVQRTKR